MSEYKKTYIGDYMKSYRHLSTWKKEEEIRKKEYENISKKLGDVPYNKDEHSKFYDISGNRPKSAADRVNADGSSNRSTTERGKIKRVWDDSDHYNKPKAKKEEKPQASEQEDDADREALLSKIAEDLRRSAGQTTSQPIIQPSTTQQSRQSQPVIAEEVEIEDDGNYNFYAYPLEEIGFERYKNLKTNKEIGVKEAKEVLSMAGYAPKPIANIGTVLFAFIIANVVLPYLAPIVAIGFGAIRLMNSRTTWTKTVGGNSYKYNFPASEEEMSANSLVGKIAIAVGIAAAGYHYIF